MPAVIEINSALNRLNRVVMEEWTSVRRFHQHRRIERAIADASGWRDARLTKPAVLWIELGGCHEIRRLRRQAFNVGVEVCVLAREEEIAGPGVQVTEETLARAFVRYIWIEGVSGIVKDVDS